MTPVYRYALYWTNIVTNGNILYINTVFPSCYAIHRPTEGVRRRHIGMKWFDEWWQLQNGAKYSYVTLKYVCLSCFILFTCSLGLNMCVLLRKWQQCAERVYTLDIKQTTSTHESCCTRSQTSTTLGFLCRLPIVYTLYCTLNGVCF